LQCDPHRSWHVQLFLDHASGEAFPQWSIFFFGNSIVKVELVAQDQDYMLRGWHVLDSFFSTQQKRIFYLFRECFRGGFPPVVIFFLEIHLLRLNW